MKWRILLGALLGWLLPVPLALLVGGALHWGPQEHDPEGARLIPVLDSEQRMSRMTYRRPCRTRSDCETPLGCLGDGRYRTPYCTDSECQTDAHCPPEHVCHRLPTIDGPLLVRRCLPRGIRAEGERCTRTPAGPDEACAPGLLCGEAGWCGRPCSANAPASCPEGFICSTAGGPPSCVPNCESRGCPEGQQCVRFAAGASACMVVHGPPCQQSPCENGRECFVDYAARRPGVVWMECVHACTPREPSCPEGFACNRWHCQRACEPERPDSCEPGYRCEQDRPDTPWVCQPDI